MKKMMKLLVLVLVIVFGLQSCEKHDEILAAENLPATAQTFIATHFPETTIIRLIKDYDDRTHTFKVTLSDGTFIEFKKDGNWREVENYATGVPEAIIPISIMEYINTNFTNNNVVSIELGRVYDVELNSGVELDFSTTGGFLRIDM